MNHRQRSAIFWQEAGRRYYELAVVLRDFTPHPASFQAPLHREAVARSRYCYQMARYAMWHHEIGQGLEVRGTAPTHQTFTQESNDDGQIINRLPYQGLQAG